MTREIDIDLLRRLLRYEPDTGKLFWLKRDISLFEPTDKRSALHLYRWWNGRFAGKEAFTAYCGSGFHGKIFGELYYAHRVIWAMEHGEWPAEVDHIKGDRTNNRKANLRAVDHLTNMQNKAIYKSSKTGFHGVTWHKGKQRWQSKITISRKVRHLGTFNTLDAAVAARREAERNAGFHSNHGRAA